MKRKICIALAVVFAAVFVFSAVNLYLTIADYQQAENLYNDVQEQYVGNPITVPSSPEQPDAPKEELIAVDFEGLLSANSDVVGWLYVPDTEINYPVVQAEDNQTYLHKGLNGKYLRSGTIFADYRNGLPMQDRNYIIYGHSMKNGSMFGKLLHYKKQAYYDKHPVWYYLTPEQNYRVELFAGRVVKTNHIIYQVNADDSEFSEYLQKSIEESTFQSDVKVTDSDAIVTLSTCSYEFDQARYVVLGKLVPIE